MPAAELVSYTATKLASLIKTKEVSCREVLEAFLGQIDALNPAVNAICTLDAVAALKIADAQDRSFDLDNLAPLAGLPIAIKDLVETKGLRTTYGSLLHKDFVPDFDQLFVTRLREAGANVIGKTNTPEFGAGSHTFNSVFGTTLNPYNLERSAGGSSGGAAAALAARMLPFADGSDLGGSLRNPAAFCNVVGFRVTPGRVPVWPTRNLWNPLPVTGPMARTVEDVALLLSAMAGPHPDYPQSLPEEGSTFRSSLKSATKGLRIAWTPDLGHLPVDGQVRSVCESACSVFEDLGAHVDPAAPDLKDANEIFQTLRAVAMAASYPEDFESLRGTVKDTVLWNVAEGHKRTGFDVSKAHIQHTLLYRRMLTFFDTYDFLILPSTQVPAFPADQEYPSEIEGRTFDTYINWMEICYAITLTGTPAISVPCGFTDEGLPVGLQIVGPPGKDLDVLKLAYAFEQATKHADRLPDILTTNQ